MHRANVLSGVVCLGLGIGFAALASQVPPFTMTDSLGGRFFPMLIAVGIIICSLGLIVTGLMNIEISGGQVGGKRASQTEATDSNADEEAAAAAAEAPILGMPAGRARLFGFIASMAVYTLILELVGYIAASLVVFTAMIVIAGERRIPKAILGAVVTTGLLYLMFAVIFGMNVPEASLF